MFNDLRYAFRMLIKTPSFTVVAVLTLALGIGANTAIFSVVDAVLLRPLDYPDSGQLVWLSERGADWSGGPISYPNYLDWKSQQSSFEAFGAYTGSSITLSGAGEPVLVSGAMVSADVFAALRREPEMGRVFRQDEDRPGAAPVAVISHSLWQNQFGGNSGILDQTINLNGKAYSVLGVMPAGFEFPSRVDVWLPLEPSSTASDWKMRNNHFGLYGLGRLKPGLSLEQARADLNVIAARLEQQYPESNKARRVQIDRLLDNKVGNVSRALWILFGAVSFVLVIACANVANLSLARAAAREKEMAVRAALGAGQWRITRQLLIESSLITFAGAAVGLIVAQGFLHLVAALAGGSIPRAAEISLDPRVLLFSGLVAVLTGIAFGLAPVWYARRVDLQRTLRESGRGSTSSRTGLRKMLIVSEVALTFVLLAGAGLLLNSFYRLLQVNPGFVVDRVLTFRMVLPGNEYPSDAQEVQFCRSLLDTLRAAPGVQSASLASQVPLNRSNWDMLFEVEGKPESSSQHPPSLQVQLVAPGYFQSMGIPLLQGRDFTEQDDQGQLQGSTAGSDWGGALKSVIIDEEFASRHWPNQNPIGQRVRILWGERDKQPVVTVVGVVGRVKKDRLRETEGMVQAYFPIFQQPLRSMAAVVKTAAEPAAMVPTLRKLVSQLDPTLPIFGIRTMEEVRDSNLASERLNLGLIGSFAAIALFLAIIGLYGLLAFIVAQRQREIGVRMALGARRVAVFNLVVGQGMRLILAGVVIGVLGSLALTRLLANVLFGVRPGDPLTLGSVTLLLCIVAFLACYVPARRAMKVDPMMALRSE